MKYVDAGNNGVPGCWLYLRIIVTNISIEAHSSVVTRCVCVGQVLVF